MTNAAQPTHDTPVPAGDTLGELYVLVQALPEVAVLATSYDRARLKREAEEMARAHVERKERLLFRWFVQKAGMHLS